MIAHRHVLSDRRRVRSRGWWRPAPAAETLSAADDRPCCDAPHPLDLKGLSLAGRASVVTDRKEFDYIGRLRLKRYPEYVATPASTPGDGIMARIEAKPTAGPAVLLRIAPEILSVSDYSKGFGHSDLVRFSERDLDVHVQSQRHLWDIVA